jgi:Fe-S-cluster containining protein
MENKNLWQKCLECKNTCCGIVDDFFPLYVTDEEKKSLNKINLEKPCAYFGQNNLCQIYDSRPIDYRMFPFDIDMADDEYFWIIWDIDCPIVREMSENESEEYLENFEKYIMPKFKDELKKYSEFRESDLTDKFSYRKLRRIKIN